MLSNDEDNRQVLPYINYLYNPSDESEEGVMNNKQFILILF